MIEYSIDLLRDTLSADSTLYNFSSPEGTVDARFMGNKARFINHGDSALENVYSQNVKSRGRYRIAFFALRDIAPDEELFFNYDGNGELYKNYKHKYPFIREKKKV